MTQRKVAQPDLIDLLLADYKKPEDLMGENGILKQLTKAIVERALQAELAAHLGHDKHERVANDSGNTRNGSSAKTLYTAATVEEAEVRLAQFDANWGTDYPSIVQSWQRNWSRIIPFFDYPAEIRKVIYTTNAIESVNMSLRKVTKSRGSFPHDEALIKLYYLALRNISKKWTMPIQNWKAALNRFTIMFDERMPQH